MLLLDFRSKIFLLKENKPIASAVCVKYTKRQSYITVPSRYFIDTNLIISDNMIIATAFTSVISFSLFLK